MSRFLLNDINPTHGEDAAFDFKRGFDIKNTRDWVEIIKDLVALSNSGGGFIVLGFEDDGSVFAEADFSSWSLDPAEITDKIYKYTDLKLSLFRVISVFYEERAFPALHAQAAEYPIVFTKPGTYPIDGGKQQSAFSHGTVYFRHGAKSDPATYDDMRSFFDRRIEMLRKQWLDGIARVVEAPAGARVQILPPEIRHTQAAGAIAIRLTSDPSAPAYFAVSVDETHPFRRKDVIAEIHKRTNGAVALTGFHIDCARKELGLDEDKKYVFKLQHASPQYSLECVELLVAKHAENAKFFADVADKNRKHRKEA